MVSPGSIILFSKNVYRQNLAQVGLQIFFKKPGDLDTSFTIFLRTLCWWRHTKVCDKRFFWLSNLHVVEGADSIKYYLHCQLFNGKMSLFTTQIQLLSYVLRVKDTYSHTHQDSMKD